MKNKIIKWITDSVTAGSGVSMSRQLLLCLTLTSCFILIWDVLHRPIGASSAAIVASMATALGAIWGLGKVRPPTPPGGTNV